MADKPNATGGIFRNPLIAVLVLLLFVAIAGFAANFFLVNQDTQRKNEYIGTANQLKALSQEIARHAAGASAGNVALFPMLGDAKNAFETNLGYLENGNPLTGLPATSGSADQPLTILSGLWQGTGTQVDMILANQEAIARLRDIAADMTISMSAIQTENNKVVATMVRLGAPANEVALAQRQSLLIERMSSAITRISETGGTKSIVDGFNRDSARFKSVLDGMVNGDKNLLLTAATDTEVQASLTRIEELYRSIVARVTEVRTRAEDVVSIKAAADGVTMTAPDFVSTVDELTDAYVADSGGFGLGSPLLGLVFGSSAMVVLLLISFMVYRESNKGLAETAARNEENQAAILQLLDELADLADGDLRVQATVTESFTGAIADSINFSIDQMRGLVSNINETSAKVSDVADRTQGSAVQLAEASQRQANEIADVSEAVNEMAVSIDMVSYNAAESSSVAERSVDIANKGSEVVQNTIRGMDNIRGQIQETAKRIKRLGESSQEIGDIVALINDIADQTNILSLNAAIQASMAGDAGKGFAVVADEVQRLAERSGAAAKQISALVKTIQSDTNEAVSSMEQTTAEVVQGTRLAQDAGVALGEIEGVSNSLAEIIENISDAARQQAASAGKISNTMKSIQEITSQTTEGTQTTASEVRNLSSMTNELRSSVTSFKLPG